MCVSFPNHPLRAAPNANWAVLGDGGQTAGNTCSNCASFNYECTYLEAARVSPFSAAFHAMAE